MISIVCPNCNNTIWVDEKQSSCFCTYCGNIIVMPTDSEHIANTRYSEILLERAFLVLEDNSLERRERVERAKEFLLTGLSVEPDNKRFLFLLSFCSSSYAERYFQNSNDDITDYEKDIINRLMRVCPELIESALLHYCFVYNAADKINYLLQKYPFVFSKEKLLSIEKAQFLKRKDYVEILLKQGMDINDIFTVYMENLSPIYSADGAVWFLEDRLPLNVFEMYLDFGLRPTYFMHFKELYKLYEKRPVDYFPGSQKTMAIETSMSLYDFFYIFEKAQEKEKKEGEYKELFIKYTRDISVRPKEDYIGEVYYYYYYKNSNYTDYMAALVKHGCMPRFKPEKPDRKRRFPWF